MLLGRKGAEITNIISSHMNVNMKLVNFNSNDVAKIGAMSGGYTPPPGANTTTEGAGLPPGELNLTQITSLMNGKK